jgi:hypothetical protein
VAALPEIGGAAVWRRRQGAGGGLGGQHGEAHGYVADLFQIGTAREVANQRLPPAWATVSLRN